MTSKRLLWIDVLKGIGVVLVIFAHLNPAMSLEKFIYSFHMFLFFFISGYLFKPYAKSELLKGIRKKTHGLLFPFLLWDAVSVIFGVIQSGNSLNETIRTFFLLDGKICKNAPIWFLWILFVIEFIFLIVNSLSDNAIISPIIPLISLSLAYFMPGKHLPFWLEIVPVGMFFYWYGAHVAVTNLLDVLERKRLVSIVSLFTLTVFISQINDRISVVMTYYGDFPLCIICGVSGVLLIALLFKFVSQYFSLASIRKIGKNSMITVCLQYPIFDILSRLSTKFTGIDAWHDTGTLKAIIITVVTLEIIFFIISPILDRLPLQIALAIGYKRNR